MLYSTLLTTALLAVGATAEQRRSRAGPARLDVEPRSEHSLEKRAFNGRATFYDVGLGACGWYNSGGDYIVALNSAQYGGGYPGPQCGKSITISYGGKTAVATIADECPTCDYGGLDLSRGLFNYFSDPGAGVFYMSWWFNDGSNQQPAAAPAPSTTQKPTPTSTYTPPTSTYTPPPATSTTERATSTASPAAAAAQSSSSAAAAQSSSQSSVSAASASSSSAAAASRSASASAASGSAVPIPVPSSAEQAAAMGNLVLFNQLVTNYGNIVVVGGENSK